MNNNHQAKIAKLRKDREQTLAKIKRLEGKDRAKMNKAEARKRFLVGEAALEEAAVNPQFNECLHKHLAARVTNAKARALLGLPPVEGEERDKQSPSPLPKNDSNATGESTLR